MPRAFAPYVFSRTMATIVPNRVAPMNDTMPKRHRANASMGTPATPTARNRHRLIAKRFSTVISTMRTIARSVKNAMRRITVPSATRFAVTTNSGMEKRVRASMAILDIPTVLPNRFLVKYAMNTKYLTQRPTRVYANAVIPTDRHCMSAPTANSVTR